jgi:hypothetical protein
MTQAEFNELPMLISRKQFRRAVGVSDPYLSQLVKQKKARQYLRGRKRALYYKVDAAKLGGFKA